MKDKRPTTPGLLVLASASPRRREIVAALGIPFQVHSVPVDETLRPGEPAEAAARRLAEAKARAAAAQWPEEAVVIGADTVVVLDGRLLGKPESPAEAGSMLRGLRGREHRVVTGVAVAAGGPRLAAGEAITRVRMRPYRDEEIGRYVSSGEPFDKAGAYAIQDPAFRPVERIEGCYLNVVGLPLCLLLYLLWEVGASVPIPPRGRLQRLCPGCVLVPEA